MPPKPQTLAAVAAKVGKKRKRRSSDILRTRTRPSAAVKRQRSIREKARVRDESLYESILGIPVIGDLILAYSKPKDTPDAIYAMTNSRGLCNTIDWMRSRIVWQDASAEDCSFKLATLDGKVHSPTDEDRDFAAISATGSKFWLKWGKLHRGGDLPACITTNKKASWHTDGEETRSIFDDEFDAYFASTVSSQI